MKRQVADRLFMTSICLLVSGSALFNERAEEHWLATIGGLPATASFIVLAVLSLFSLADTVVNDMLPEKFTFKVGWRLRQSVWLAIGITFVAVSFASIRLGGSAWTAAILVAYGMRCSAVSFLDLYYEHRNASQGRRSTDFGELS